jgi:hypothetical protein
VPARPLTGYWALYWMLRRAITPRSALGRLILRVRGALRG